MHYPQKGHFQGCRYKVSYRKLVYKLKSVSKHPLWCHNNVKRFTLVQSTLFICYLMLWLTEGSCTFRFTYSLDQGSHMTHSQSCWVNKVQTQIWVMMNLNTIMSQSVNKESQGCSCSFESFKLTGDFTLTKSIVI